MRILFILQNAWGGSRLPLTFVPNPYNHSARVALKMTGPGHHLEFGNTTDVVTETAKGHPKPNYTHFERLIKTIPQFDMVMVGGTQATETVNRYIEQIRGYGKPMIFVPHPASRTLTNKRCDEIRAEVAAIQAQLEAKRTSL